MCKLNLSSFIVTIFSLLCYLSNHLCDSFNNGGNNSRQLPPPENEFYAREQLYIAPIKKAHDEALTCGQLIASRGFKYERHFVTTEDGYILQLYRIINPYAQQALGSKLIPVLLVHGILTSCSSWMFNGYDGFIEPWVDGKPANVMSNSLAFVLGNCEFDVWIANSRGTTYSLNHTRLNAFKDPEFWNFSFADMGKYDTPAMVNYIIDKTEHEKVVYIGYSQGSQQMFIQITENPSFADKLYLNINIAPIAFYGNSRGLVSLIPRERIFYLSLANYVGPLPPFLSEFDAGLTAFCTNPINKQLCIEIYGAIFGPDRPLVDEEIFQVLTSLIDTISNKDALHNLQTMHFDQTRKYDYGPKKNLEIYNSTEPPKYQFENMPTYNLVLISGLNDYLADPIDVQKLRNLLRSVGKEPMIDYVIPYAKWSHTDIIFGNRAYEYAHSFIVKTLRDFFGRNK